MEKLLAMSEVIQSFGHMCRFGLRHPCGMPIRKPTWWVTNSPEVACAVGLKCNCQGEHAPCMGGQVAHDAARYTPALAKAVLNGYFEHLSRVDPERLYGLQSALRKQVRTLKLRLDLGKVTMLKKLERWRERRTQVVNVVVDEGTVLPEDGIEFDVDPKLKPPKPLLAAVRRLHINTGHPTNADLERVCRLAGGSADACGRRDNYRSRSSTRRRNMRMCEREGET